MEQSQLQLPFTPNKEPDITDNAMPTLKFKKEPKPRPLKVVTKTLSEMVKATLKNLDAQIAYHQALQGGAKLLPEDNRPSPEYKMTDKNGALVPEVVRKVTEPGCWRPDLYFAASKFCDQCGLFPHCMSKLKRLKDPASQDRDQTAKFRKAEAAKEMLDPEDEVVVAVVAAPAPIAKRTIQIKTQAKSGLKLVIKRR